uniref:Opsin-2 n=1 Tax=Pleurobrachia bachei TaxID=34499 RepID=S4TLJ1_PLEBA|nr:opsin-2 [Pleurobrachia bachei]
MTMETNITSAANSQNRSSAAQTAADPDEVVGEDPKVVYSLASLLALNALGSIIGNALVIYTFLKEKPLGAPLRIILTHLAVTNLIIATIGEPMVVISGFSSEYSGKQGRSGLEFSFVKWVFGEMGRGFEAFVVTSCGLMAMSLLALVSIERYLRVTPRQRFPFTEPTAVKCCSFLWVFNVIYASLPFYGIAKWNGEGIGISNSITWETKNKEDFIYIICMMCTGYFIPLFVIAFCYNRILFFVKQAVDVYDDNFIVGQPAEMTMETNITSAANSQNRSSAAQTSKNMKTDEQSGSSRIEPNTDQNSGDELATGDMNTHNIIKAAERKISHVIAVIIMSFFISWTPYTVVNLLVTFDNEHAFSKGIHATIPAFMAKTSTLWSPIIYCAMNGEVRTANMKTLSKLRRRIRVLYFGGTV